MGRRNSVAIILTALTAIPSLLAAQPLTTLFGFDGTDGAFPEAPLIYHDGTLYGTTFQGGDVTCYRGYTCGTVFAVNAASGKETVLHNFAGYPHDGGYPLAGVVYEGDKLFGLTSEGGPKDFGTLFSVDPHTGAEKILVDFRNARQSAPAASLTVHGGTLYGTTGSTLFRVDAASGMLTTLVSFHNNSLFPDSVTYRNGMLYGSLYQGGPYRSGKAYKVDLATLSLTTLFLFNDGAQGGGPTGATALHGQFMYGTTYRGGSGCGSGCGTVFQVDVNTRREKVLYAFTGGADGHGPQTGLIWVNGFLYGADRGANSGCETNGCGTVFKVDPATGIETVLYTFTGGADGGLPIGGLTYANGYLYGTTTLGGNTACNNGNGCGTVFKLAP